jgi:DNA segregation ATPase FtsK/SpoIIIE-like protein
MKSLRQHRARRPARAPMVLAVATLLSAVMVLPAQAQYDGEEQVIGNGDEWFYDRGSVVSIYVDAPLQEPEPVAIGWAPPPMLVEELPPPPYQDAVWTGGYWTWQGDWVWCAGRWLVPPRPRYVWVQPYYEHREERVIFLPGYWSRPDVEFVAPSYSRQIAWAYVGANVVVGPPPTGPAGIFIPPPPGSRPGIIIPAPVGTPPAVVVSAPPVMNVGMVVRGNVNINSHNTVVNDNRVTNYNITNVRNVTNVVIQAPAGAMANGRAFQSTVPHQADLAAAQQPFVSVRAPVPLSRTPVQAYVPGHTVAALPAPQRVQGLPTVPSHPVATLSPAQRSQMAHPPIVPAPHASPLPGEGGSRSVSAIPTPMLKQPAQRRPAEDGRQRRAPAGEQQPASVQAAELQRQRGQQDAPQQRALAEEQAHQSASQLPRQEQLQQRAQADEQARQRAQQSTELQRRQADEQARQRAQVQQKPAQVDERAQQVQQQQRVLAEQQARQREPQQSQQQRVQAEERAQQAQQQQRAQAAEQARQREQQQGQQQRVQAEERAQQARQQQQVQADEQARQRAQRQSQPPRPAEADAGGRPAPRASSPSNGHPAADSERVR